ncbi:MAG: septum site-determining protein MinC [Proteobacteria bacterium]|nr:septum site-determining protein MinC [Pseudomonadota bacterium]
MTNNEMLPVRLKGVGDSLRITLDPSQPFDLLQREIGKLFERLKHLAINARVIIDPGEQGDHETLIENIGSYLKETFSVGTVTGPPQKRSITEERMRTRDMEQSWEHHRSDVLILSGRVRSGQKVQAKKHLFILGDVNPGAEISAGGDIMVMGRLCGSVLAGQPSNEDAIVLALDFRPSLVQIGNLVAAGALATKGESAEFAHIDDGQVVVDNYLKANPFGKLPWPITR